MTMRLDADAALPDSGPLGPVGERVVLMFGVALAAGVLLAVMAVPVAMLASEGLQVVGRDILDVPPLPDAQPAAQNSYILAADGSRLAELNFEQNRRPVDYEQIPEVMRQAVIATEDAAFYQHAGVNPQAIVRAAVANVRAGDITQGGSTITQQYVKNAYIGIAEADQSLNRKIKEAVWAVEVERRLTKREILTGYLNYAYFGNGVYGVGTAARRYFSQPVSKLSLSQAALLAGLIRAPETNDPLTEDGRARAVQRRDTVLAQMAREGFVTSAQAEAAAAEPAGLKPRTLGSAREQFWVSWVTELLTNRQTAKQLGSAVGALEAMGETSDDRINRVFQSGIRIHTTLEPKWQQQAQKAIREHLTAEGATPAEIAREPLGSIVSVEPATGAIRTMAVGPRKFGSCQETEYVGTGEDGRLLCDKTKLNPAVPGGGGSGRQPGSAYKPFVAATALEQGVPPRWTVDASSGQVIDRSVCPNGGKPWRVSNAGGGGMTDLYTGTKRSVNVFYAKLMAEVGPQPVTDMANRLGIFHSTTTDRWLPVCSQALGTQEVYPLEMASAYATFANRGTRCRPFAISRIEDRDGDTIYEYTPDCERVLSQDIADRVIDLMAGPVTSGGTAPVANLGRWPTRGKTGTTQDNRDAWFVGYVRQLATAAWIGYPNGAVRYESMAAARKACPDQLGADAEQPVCRETRLLRNVTIGGSSYGQVYGSTIPAPMWRDYMAAVVEQFTPKGWPDPGPGPMTRVPNLLAAGSLDEAEKLLETVDLRLVTEQVRHYLPKGEFVAQSPEAGKKAPAGSVVTLRISDGTGQAPRVPDVVGMPRGPAERQLKRAGFQVQVVTGTTGERSQDGRVIEQQPSANARHAPARPGVKATVTITVGEYDPALDTDPVEPTPDPIPTELPGDDDTSGLDPDDFPFPTPGPIPTPSEP